MANFRLVYTIYLPLMCMQSVAALRYSSSVNLFEFTPRIRRTDSSPHNICLPCPPHSHSSFDSSSEHACLCTPGFIRFEGDCVPCPANHYKSFYGSHNCMQCQENSMSSPGSHNCSCTPGFTRDAHMQCVPCLPGELKEVSGDGACDKCPANTYNTEVGLSTPCTSCRDHSSSPVGSTSEDACKCNAGVYLSPRRQCEICPENRFCPAVSDVAFNCTQDSHGGVGLASAEQCVCNEGYARSEGPACHLCEADTWCSNGTRTSCISYSASPKGSSREDACVCDGGFARPGV